MEIIRSREKLHDLIKNANPPLFQKKIKGYMVSHFDGDINTSYIEDTLNEEYENLSIDRVRGMIMPGKEINPETGKNIFTNTEEINFIFEPQHYKQAAWRSKKEWIEKNRESFMHSYQRWKSITRGMDKEGFYDRSIGEIILTASEENMNYILKIDQRWKNTGLKDLIDVRAVRTEKAQELLYSVFTIDRSIYF